MEEAKNKKKITVKGRLFFTMVGAILLLTTLLVYKYLLPLGYVLTIVNYILIITIWIFLIALIIFIAIIISEKPSLSSCVTASVATIIFSISFGFFLFATDKYIAPWLLNKTSTEVSQQEQPPEKIESTKIDSGSKLRKKDPNLTTASNNMSDDTLLNILAILLSFTGLLAVALSYAFHQIIKKEFESNMEKRTDGLSQSVKETSHDERMASKTETLLATSHVFSKLYALAQKIKEEEEKPQDGNCKNNPCKARKALEENDFLTQAIIQDDLAIKSFEEISDPSRYADIYLKALNNRGYNLCLKYEKGTEEMTYEENSIILETKQKLRAFMNNEDPYSYEDISSKYRKPWDDTLKKIEELLISNRGKDLKEMEDRLYKKP